jgi:hypothetical protein
MESSKEWYKSKTIWAALVTVVVGTLAMAGVGELEGQEDSLVELIMQIVTLVSGVLALVGRITAKAKVSGPGGSSLLLLALGLLLIGGCVTIAPEQAAATRQAAVIVGELDRRCQDGDAAACADGLHLAARSLDLAANAMDRKGGEGH